MQVAWKLVPGGLELSVLSDGGFRHFKLEQICEAPGWILREKSVSSVLKVLALDPNNQLVDCRVEDGLQVTSQPASGILRPGPNSIMHWVNCKEGVRALAWAPQPAACPLLYAAKTHLQRPASNADHRDEIVVGQVDSLSHLVLAEGMKLGKNQGLCQDDAGEDGRSPLQLLQEAQSGVKGILSISWDSSGSILQVLCKEKALWLHFT